MLPITEYCRQVLGWVKLEFTLAAPGKEEYSCAFIRNDGIHFMATAKSINHVELIHVTIAPLTKMSDLPEGQLLAYIEEQTPSILEDFFPGRRFAKQPDDLRRPQAKHYFSII